MGKKILSLLLVIPVILGPMTVKAEIEEIPVITPEEVEQPAYFRFDGEIKEINSADGNFSILVENDYKDELDKLLAFITEDVVVVMDDTMEFIEKEKLTKGMVVSIYYHRETPMLMTYPPQLEPDAVVVRTKSYISTMADIFDHNLLSTDGSMRLVIREDTEIVDSEGNKVAKDKIGNTDLLFSYTVIMESYPMQVAADKIIVLRLNEPKVMDKVIINEKEIKLNDKIYIKDNTVMVPLRQIAEALKYKVDWEHETYTAVLTKEGEEIRVTIGDNDCYSLGIIFRLNTKPELIDSRTFVPVSFFKNVLFANISYTSDGILKIFN